jgi:hypothetical protein
MPFRSRQRDNDISLAIGRFEARSSKPFTVLI